MSDLLKIEQVAERLALSPSGVRKMRDADRMPAPVRLGRAIRFRASEIEAWVAAGCPCRDKWESMRESAPRREVRRAG